MGYDIIIGRGEGEKAKLGKEGTIFLGRHYVKMGQTTSLSNDIFMDVVRSHVVFVTGKRGSGKCLHGDTLITLDNGEQVSIKDLSQRTENILSLNHDLKICPQMKEGFYERKVNKLLHIIFRSGREIKLTPEHPLLTIHGWKPAMELKFSDRIAAARKIPIQGENSLDEHEIKILAYLLTEGHTKRSILFSNFDHIIVNDLELALKYLHPNLELTKMKEGCYKINSKNILPKNKNIKIVRDKLGRFTEETIIYYGKTQVRKFCEKYKLYGKGALEKSIPKEVFVLTNIKLALFLNRMFSCDGSIYRLSQEDWEISYSSSSQLMASQVQSLLLRFGIQSKLRTKWIPYKGDKRKTFELVLNGENVEKFIKEIGFFGNKIEREKQALIDLCQRKYNPNVDTIPKELWDYYRPANWADVGRALGYRHPKALRESIRYSCSRQKLLQIATAENNQRLKLLAQSDIFWDEIVSINELYGNFSVYDISVPEYHNFVANNIIVHNSYSMGVIAEGMSDLPKEISDNMAVVMLDTMGIYWTMKYPNKKDEEEMKEWNIEPKSLNIKIYTPVGYFEKFKEAGIPTDEPFSIKPSELSPADWALTFTIDINSSLGILIERVIEDLKETNDDYSMDDIIKAIKNDKRTEQITKDAAENRFEAANKWGIFSEEGTPIDDIAVGGQVTVLDVSAYTVTPGAEGLRALVIGLVSKKLFLDRMIARKKEELDAIKETIHYLSEEERFMKKRYPLVWLIIDEAHEFLPSEGTTAATQALITILREGRQPGISLVLASQQPGKIHSDVMTQSDIVIGHRVTAKTDIDALGTLMQSYMREGLDKQLNYLPSESGAAIVFDDLNERLYPMRIRPRMTWHGGEAPLALQKKKEIFSF